jgi:hypothetical protein
MAILDIFQKNSTQLFLVESLNESVGCVSENRRVLGKLKGSPSGRQTLALRPNLLNASIGHQCPRNEQPLAAGLDSILYWRRRLELAYDTKPILDMYRAILTKVWVAPRLAYVRGVFATLVFTLCMYT